MCTFQKAAVLFWTRATELQWGETPSAFLLLFIHGPKGSVKRTRCGFHRISQFTTHALHPWARRSVPSVTAGGSWNQICRHFFMTRLEVGDTDCSHADAPSHLHVDVPGHLHHPRHPLLQRPGEPARRRGWRWERTCSHGLGGHHRAVCESILTVWIHDRVMHICAGELPAGSCMTEAHGQDLGQLSDRFGHS